MYTHGTYLSTLDPSSFHLFKWIGPWDRGSYLFFNIKSLNLWVTDEGVKGMGLTQTWYMGPSKMSLSIPHKYHDQWVPSWAPLSLSLTMCILPWTAYILFVCICGPLIKESGFPNLEAHWGHHISYIYTHQISPTITKFLLEIFLLQYWHDLLFIPSPSTMFFSDSDFFCTGEKKNS